MRKKIALERIIPEHRKAKKIEVTENGSTASKKQMLTEEQKDELSEKL